MKSRLTEEMLVCNLKDAGCGDAAVETFLGLYREGRRREQFRLLAGHRAALLDKVHVSQRMIDCLDYLIYTLEQEGE